MDVQHVIRDLRARQEAVERAIAELEALAVAVVATPRPVTRRGRKSMAGPERRAVSERMKRYWARRREARGHNATIAPVAAGAP